MTESTLDEASTLRRGALGAPEIFFFVVAAAAPLAATVGNAPLAILLGNGPGAPGAYLIAGVVLGLFAIGFARMSHHVRGGGAFYIYISRGFGSTVGSAAAFMAALSYAAIVIGAGAATGYFAHIVFQAQLGINLPWEAWGAISLLIVGVLGYREVVLGARLLGVALILEMSILLVFDIIVLVKGGAHGTSLRSFAPSTVFHGSVGIALIFAFASFLGFESAAIYSGEARDGHRTVRRALLAAVAFIGFFYTFSVWCLVNAYGVSHVLAAAAKDPGVLIFGAYGQYTGSALTTIVQILEVTSSLASLLALHNACSRYLFSLSRRSLLPAWLGRSHHRFKSPHTASVATSLFTVVILVIYALANADPLLTIVSTTFGVATLGIIVLQAATSAAVVVYFSRHPVEHAVSTIITTGVACVALLAVVVLVLRNYGVLSGQHGVLNLLPVLLIIAAAIGAVAGLRHDRRRLAGSLPAIGDEAAIDVEL